MDNNPEINPDFLYMGRALQLAGCGGGRVAPNPMVGAVIVAGGRIIGQGFHAMYGGPHAEVHAIASVKSKDMELLCKSTIYVTLEPCAHFGKTPPCASLIISTGIPRVVIGSTDPNPLVAGKGIAMLENAGIKVVSGVMKKECDELNKRFMTFHLLKRPWIQLKWAESADGFMADTDNEGNPVPVKFSNPLSAVWMHRERARGEAIMVGSNTIRIDNPRLDVRKWGGKSPLKIECEHAMDLKSLIDGLYQKKITSLMVEGGPTLLNSFLKAGFYDEIRIETTSFPLGKGLRSPLLPDGLHLLSTEYVRENVIRNFRR